MSRSSIHPTPIHPFLLAVVLAFLFGHANASAGSPPAKRVGEAQGYGLARSTPPVVVTFDDGGVAVGAFLAVRWECVNASSESIHLRFTADLVVPRVDERGAGGVTYASREAVEMARAGNVSFARIFAGEAVRSDAVHVIESQGIVIVDAPLHLLREVNVTLVPGSAGARVDGVEGALPWTFWLPDRPHLSGIVHRFDADGRGRPDALPPALTEWWEAPIVAAREANGSARLLYEPASGLLVGIAGGAYADDLLRALIHVDSIRGPDRAVMKLSLVTNETLLAALNRDPTRPSGVRIPDAGTLAVIVIAGAAVASRRRDERARAHPRVT